MGRTKTAPTRNRTRNENEQDWILDRPIDYIPIRKRKTTNKSRPPHVYDVPLAKEEDEKLYLGKFIIGTTNNSLIENFTSCELSFLDKRLDDAEIDGLSHECDSIMLHFNSFTVVVNLIIETATLKSIITSKTIFVYHFEESNHGLYLKLYLKEIPLPKFNKNNGKVLQNVFFIIFNISSSLDEQNGDESNESTNEQINQLYKNVKKYREENLPIASFSPEIAHSKLNPQLRPYQEDAVCWMLQKERPKSHEKMLHPLYTEVTLPSGVVLYYDKTTGYIDIQKPVTSTNSACGILADEMGLGKTVEVLGCILLHRKPRRSIETDGDEEKDGNKNDENEYLDELPTIETVTRKRKRHVQTVDDTVNDIPDEYKKLKVPEGWVKGGKRKSELRLALEKWYDATLQSAVKPKNDEKPAPCVQCICGQNHEDGTISCVLCEKIQHSDCLGYKDTFGEYKCPQCWQNEPLLECAATLIVTPISLRNQWCEEIMKHVRGRFKVLQYGGVALTPVYPTKLLDYDVVITNYAVLQNEMRLTETNQTVTFRNQRKYSPPGCPLTRLNWWRLCLDEAQTVEATSSMVSQMAQKISAIYRWAVTGTPISKHISDLYGLIDYLQIEPYNDYTTWKHILFDTYNRGNHDNMIRFLANVLWRSSKDEVLNQINIPEQTVKEHWLTFSAVEQFFYKCEHQQCRRLLLEKTEKLDSLQTLHKMDRGTLKGLLAPLKSLRQLCTYAKSVRTRYLVTKKLNSMKDLLEALVAKNIVECEEYLRVVLSSLNGLAGIYLLNENVNEAIATYRKVLQLYTRFTEEEKVSNKLAVDKLQIIHTMHNLTEILLVAPDGVDKTLRDDTLLQDCRNVEQNYIGKFVNNSLTALEEWLTVSKSVEKCMNSFSIMGGHWYSSLLDWIYLKDHHNELITKLINLFDNASVEKQQFNSKQSLLYLIATWDDEISEKKETLTKCINALFSHCPNEKFQIIVKKSLVEQVRDCHLRPDKKSKNKKKCKLCHTNDKLKNYEFVLFSMTKRNVSDEELSLKGSWKPKAEELIFKAMLSVSKSKGAEPELVQNCETFLELLENLKKEFKEIRKLWTYIDEQICALDELEICKIRLQLKEADEENSKKKISATLKNLNYNIEKEGTIHLIKEEELPYYRVNLINEETLNMSFLEKNLGIRSYLQTLHQQQYEGAKPDPCPICKNNLEQHWSILPCGHTYCMECIPLIIDQHHGQKIQCSVCRETHTANEISYIKHGYQNTEERGTNIKGNYSTKVEAVIHLIQELKEADETVKVLVFSSWVSVLIYIKDALANNLVSAELVKTASNLEKQIDKFKSEEQKVTALLLPINLGGKGLNLVEATHVILIEPLLNTGEELQAIGRVHRIGQSRPTFVHKFYIKNTIEESIYNATSSNEQNWENNKVTLGQLTSLFEDEA